MNIEDKIGIIGLGKLGLPMLSAFISRGFQPIGYDIDSKLIAKIKKNINPYNEPGLQNIINSDPLWNSRFYDNFEKFLSKCNIVFLIVPTPTKDEIFDTSYVDSSLSSICTYANNKNKNYTVVITSTVNPGDCSKFQEYVSKKTSSNINIVYSPEFIALGSVLRDMLRPDIVLLGSNSQSSIDKIFSIYSRLYISHPEFHRLSFLEAETAKIAINTFVTTKISYANTIGLFIEEKTGSRKAAQRVLNAIGGDSRIGRKYFKYGVSYGGPCFPRDNRALGHHLKDSGIPDFIPVATDNLNKFILDYWIDKINSANYKAIAFIGIAYKSGTDFLEESFIINLASNLKQDIYFHDEIIKEYKGFEPLDLINHVNQLKKYEKVLVVFNYGNFNFDKSLNNLDKINIWTEIN